MAAKSVSVPVTGNTAPLRKSLSKASKDLDKFKKEAKSSMTEAAQAFAVAGAAMGGLAFKFYEGFQRAEQANKRVFAIAKSMNLFGSETGKVTKRLTDLGDQLERETGLTAESIKETQAKLLTFKQIAITADEAGGAFDRATQAAIDMGAAGFGEATNNAVQLGKALQNPIKGVTALARSGITFTDQERAKIRALVESNRMLEAQDMILDAVETQVQGTAAATATATTKMRNAFGEVSDIVGESLAPAFESSAKELQKFAAWAAKNEPIVAAMGVALIVLPGAIMAVRGAMLVAKGISWAYAAAQAAVAASNIAVQASTVVGIVTAGIAAAAIATLTAKVYSSVKANNAHEESIAAVSEETGQLKVQIDRAREATAKKQAADEAAAAAQQKAQEDAAKAVEAEKDRYRAFKDNLKSAKESIRAYVAEIATAINSQVKLSTAVADAADMQQTATDKLNEALQERREAYAALQQAQATGDTKAYADALQNVALAESKVNDAQAAKPKNYAQIFAEQIAAAKQFAGYVKQLAAAGLSRAGLAQILDLGPVAGAQVAKDLLAGTNGMSISSLNTDLADIAATGTAAGMAIPGFAETLGATAGRAGANSYYITIEAGVSSPTDIAKTVEGVLQTYGSTSGGIKVKTKRPKAAAGKRK
jgi:hypothetical protein